MKSGVFFLLLFSLGIICCKKPTADLNEAFIPSVTFYSSLQDTLGTRTFIQLGIDDVIGTKIRNTRGLDVRYFSYQHPNPDEVLNIISRAPFSRSAFIADTTARLIPCDDFLLSLEGSGTANSYDENLIEGIDDNCEVYECIKQPLIHHLIINRNTGNIFHRIIVEA